MSVGTLVTHGKGGILSLKQDSGGQPVHWGMQLV
ncbi:hypothetical protein SAMN05443661_11314 [Natronobacterium gregoryi]|uniref:Uncharacterized protein n=2 Tax=Natronobacterium gregoryi TaxID=44930 RepID=L0AJT5_NATGS|nr:hypothetical protein Natgr_2928 [Natronobacterium gregoryi SP2]SFJ06398.1 hypothetical protein SAMN05443661_11314 [Natronobacterium gregoryi]